MATRWLAVAVLCFSAATPARADSGPAGGATLAVLDFSNKLSAKELSQADAIYFSDITRGAALKALPSLKVMTRENLLVLLQANGKDLSSCEGECEVDTGRRIGADYIISGELLKIGSSYKLNLRLHETHAGRMLSGEIASGKTIDELDTNTVAAVQRLLAPLKSDGALIAPASPETNLIVPATAAPDSSIRSNGAANTSSNNTSSNNSSVGSSNPAAPPQAFDASKKHLGFFFRAELGGGYMSASEADTTVSGAAGGFALQFGYSPWESHVFGLQLYDTIASNPSYSTSEGAGQTTDASLSSFGVGVFYTYYFMPISLYLSGGLGVSTLSLTINDNSSSASAGLGLRFAVGKDWWLSDHFGLGAQAQLSYASNSDTEATASTVVFTLAVVATYY